MQEPTADFSRGDENELLGRHVFALGTELLTVVWSDGRVDGTLVQEVDQNASPDELRSIADLWESFPAWLRERAAELEESGREQSRVVASSAS
ncbi:hypothetical protein FHX48_000694 [Microbacterium halimionae]|uniref:Uncharacterized protein n=1 Tax=Microbacterium halimionae TaxID=1526413 RepID=A0A7W3JML6_9MICO|nr:hypothetical protein [Microbacterium halimionae]MBA8815642.1 hypothetical protein [Microbacterium halimionae]NII95689.1 hypothetical protein [Microbacterium halimionae]